jgi:glycosyltransferase involved in cell wall biosynthesis
MPKSTVSIQPTAGTESTALEPCKVSIVIAAYNAAGHISRCLETVFGQTYKDLQVIVVDDASTDATADVVRSFGDRVEYFRLDRNRGPAYARTFGLLRCRGEFTAIIDADDYWLPEFVETTVAFLASHPEAAAVSTAYRSRRWDGRELQLPVLDEADAARFPSSGAIIDDFFGFWSRWMHILTGTVLMRTAVVRQTGGQREELRLTEDLEFWGYLATFGAWGFIPQHLFVTDERAISARERLTKLKKRYKLFSVISTAEWEKRIRPRVIPEDSISFDAVVERMGVAIAIANAYSGSFRRAWELAYMYRKSLGPGLGTVLQLGLRCRPAIWPLFCLSIRLREYVIAYFPGLTGLVRRRTAAAAEPLDRIRVLFISSSLPKASDRNMNYFQRAHFLSRWTDLTLLARDGADFSCAARADSTVIFSPWPGKGGHLAYALLGCLNPLGRRRFDIVITGPSILGLCGFFMSLLTGSKWVVDIWDIPIRNDKEGSKFARFRFNIIRRVMRLLYRRACFFIVSIVPDLELGYFGIPEAKMLLLHNAIWPEESPPEGRRGEDDVSFNIFCMRSVYYPDMGLDTLASAYLKLKGEIPRLTLTIVGIIPPSVSHQISDIKGLAGVQFIDFVEHTELKEKIRSASVCVVPFKDVPDLAQTYPIKVLEYMALGKPVVASNITGIKRLIKDGENGLLFRAGDAADLAEKVLLLYRDEHLFLTIAHSAARCAERFDCRAKNFEIIAALRRLVTSPRKVHASAGDEAA